MPTRGLDAAHMAVLPAHRRGGQPQPDRAQGVQVLAAGGAVRAMVRRVVARSRFVNLWRMMRDQLGEARLTPTLTPTSWARRATC